MSVTVVIPIFNEGGNLARISQQILHEPWDDALPLDELVIIDGASTDNTLLVAESLACEDRRVRIVRHAQRLGKNAAVRDGLASCRSDAIIFVDADVYLERGCLVKMVQLLCEKPALGAVSCLNEPLPGRSWREQASRFQLAYNAELTLRAHGALSRVWVLRSSITAGLRVPDDTADDLFVMRWLSNSGYPFEVRTDAVAKVKGAIGLRDFAKQTLRHRLSGQSLERILPANPPPPRPADRRMVVAASIASAIKRVPLGFVIYTVWRGIIAVTPTTVWLPVFDHSRFNTSQSTKNLGL